MKTGKDIRLLKNNDRRDWTDVERVEEFYQFLQGKVPEGITLRRGHGVKLSPKQAFTVIWYLQEHFSLLPDQIEKCNTCGVIYDSYSEGYYSEKRRKNFCGACDDGED